LAKTWVLDTQTKGTGAHVVPLEDVLRKPGSEPVPGFGFRRPEPRPDAPAQQPEPHRFKVVDLMTREALADGVDARTAVHVLEDVRSIVDVSIFVWEPNTERWRMLTFGESSLLWENRGRSAEPG
jgi:hypothetical protein